MFPINGFRKSTIGLFGKKYKDYNQRTARAQYYQISGAYHMNKTHWNSIICEAWKPEFIKNLIDDSYQLV